jgi:hypothetical protein
MPITLPEELHKVQEYGEKRKKGAEGEEGNKEEGGGLKGRGALFVLRLAKKEFVMLKLGHMPRFGSAAVGFYLSICWNR